MKPNTAKELLCGILRWSLSRALQPECEHLIPLIQGGLQQCLDGKCVSFSQGAKVSAAKHEVMIFHWMLHPLDVPIGFT